MRGGGRWDKSLEHSTSTDHRQDLPWKRSLHTFKEHRSKSFEQRLHFLRLNPFMHRAFLRSESIDEFNGWDVRVQSRRHDAAVAEWKNHHAVSSRRFSTVTMNRDLLLEDVSLLLFVMKYNVNRLKETNSCAMHRNWWSDSDRCNSSMFSRHTERDRARIGEGKRSGRLLIKVLLKNVSLATCRGWDRFSCGIRWSKLVRVRVYILPWLVILQTEKFINNAHTRWSLRWTYGKAFTWTKWNRQRSKVSDPLVDV